MRIERLESKLIGLIKKKSGERSSTVQLVYCILLTVLLGLTEYLTENKFAMTVLYLVPVSLAALRAGKTHGYMLAVISGSVMETGALLAEKQSLFSIISCVNILLACALFLSFVLLVCALQNAYEAEARTSRQDYLTGLPNVKSFSEVLAKEIERCRRFKHPFSVAYISGNNFVHSSKELRGGRGDGILRLMAECMRSTLRNTDVVARIHDDEFVMLLTETNYAAAEIAMAKLKSGLNEIITQHHPELEFSIGIASFDKCPYSFKEVVDMAELAMHHSRMQQNRI